MFARCNVRRLSGVERDKQGSFDEGGFGDGAADNEFNRAFSGVV